MKWGLLWLRSIAALFFQLLLCPYRLCCGLALENRITFMEYVLRKSLVCTSNCFINFFHLNIQHRLPNYGKSYVDHSSLCSCTFIFSFSFCDEGCLEGSLSLYNINGFLLSVSTITSVFQGGQHDSVSPLCCSGTIGELLIFYWFLFYFFLHLPDLFDVAPFFCRDHFKLPCNARTGLDLTVLVLVWSGASSLREGNKTMLQSSRWSV